MNSTTPHVSEQLDIVQYDVVHTTTYSYNDTKRSSVMSLCMKPRSSDRQQLQTYMLNVEPNTLILEDTDFFGNTRHYFDVHRPHQDLVISSNSQVVRFDNAEPTSKNGTSEWTDLPKSSEEWNLWEYVQPSELTKTHVDLKSWCEQLGDLDDQTPLSFLESLKHRLSETITYSPGRTTIDSTVDDVLSHREGVCQDISQLMIAIARSWGIPARYVSGYLYDEPKDQRPSIGDATHAWVECFLPKHGWRSFDPTNPTATDSAHIVVAYGRDYRDVPPTKGVTLGDGSTEMEVDVVVARKMVKGE